MGFTDGVDASGRPVVHPRPQHTPEYLNTVYACGERRDHKIRVHRSNWPPRENPSVADRPFATGLCERCGAQVQVYDPPDRSVTVVLYGDASEQMGRVEDEGGTVLEESAVSEAGQVIDEPEPATKKGRRW